MATFLFLQKNIDNLLKINYNQIARVLSVQFLGATSSENKEQMTITTGGEN